MPDYYQNPYDDDQRRTGGAQANGQTGAATQASVQNAGQQSKPSDPYAAYANLGQSWANTISGAKKGGLATRTSDQSPDWNPGEPPQGPFPRYVDNEVTQYPDYSNPPQPPVSIPPSVNTTYVPPQPNAQVPASNTSDQGATNPDVPNAPSLEPTAPRQKPQSVSDETWSKAQLWVQQAGPEYAWLLDKPEAIDQYTKEAYDLEALGVTGLNFTDWARVRDYNSPIDRGTLKAPPQFLQMGGDDHAYETMVRWLADGSSKYGTGVMKPYAETLQRAPGLISAYENEMQQAEQNGFTGIHFVDWLVNQGGFPSPMAGQMGQESSDAAAAWARFRATGSSEPEPQPMWPGGPPPPEPGFVAPPGTMGGPPLPPPTSPQGPIPSEPPHEYPNESAPIVPPGLVPPIAVPPVVASPPPASQYPPDFDATTLRMANVDYLDPVYKDAMDEVRRQMMQTGAMSGQIDSGGFGSSMAKGLAPIANQFAAQKGQLQFQAQQANADRLLDKYKFDNADDLQRWLAENEATLTREGIDKNIVLQKWVTENKAQLEREGYDVQKWIADLNAKTGLAQAQLGAEAAHASAGASSAAARYNADLDYKLGTAQLGYNFWNSDQSRQYDDRFNQRGYDLGVQGINRDVYGMDQTQLRYLMDLMYRQSPDARLNGNTIQLPGMTPY